MGEECFRKCLGPDQRKNGNNTKIVDFQEHLGVHSSTDCNGDETPGGSRKSQTTSIYTFRYRNTSRKFRASMIWEPISIVAAKKIGQSIVLVILSTVLFGIQFGISFFAQVRWHPTTSLQWRMQPTGFPCIFCKGRQQFSWTLGADAPPLGLLFPILR